MIEVYNEVHIVTHSLTSARSTLQQTMLAAVDCSRDILQLL